MPAFRSLTLKQLSRRPARTTALILLAMLLSLSITGGTLIISGLKSGLDSLESRLGADIMVVPYEVRTKTNINNLFLQGNNGYYYVGKQYLDKLYDGSIEGIGQISEQYYFATASSGCCSAALQLIAFDPKTDFTIKPWINVSYKDELQDCEIVVGNDINAFPGDTLVFYGVECKVAARMDKTGTYLDTSVYTSPATIEKLIENAQSRQLAAYTGNTSPSTHTSCVLINVAEGYTVEEVLNDINVHVKKVVAIQSKNLIANVANGLTNVSGIISVLVLVIWILSLIIMVIAFTMMINERKKEFAIIRVVGASEKMLTHMVVREAFVVSSSGSLLGALFGSLIVSLFSGMIEESLDLPFLLPSVPELAVLFLTALLAATVSGSLAASYAALRISRIDPALTLREDN
ncbi:MAG: ABC transporter permease [Lachnospiraceae bacterium]|nr:ABC transporter permease [Lachnospiraceae bacterium]